MALKSSAGSAVRTYEIVALQVPIVFNKHGDHDHDGMIYVLKEHEAEIKDFRDKYGNRRQFPNYEYRSKPHPLVRPLVLRARKNETIHIRLRNEIQNRKVGIHLIADGYDVKTSDGSHVGQNKSSLVTYQKEKNYTWKCEQEGVFPFHDMGDLSGSEQGSNAHGLFGALVVEPENATWTDPTNGQPAVDGLYVDVHPLGTREQQVNHPNGKAPYLQPEPPAYALENTSFREYVIFFHDEPDVQAGHLSADECEDQRDPCEQDTVFNSCEAHAHGGDGHHELDIPEEQLHLLHCRGVHTDATHSTMVMPISYRAEPMAAREALLWKRFNKGDFPNPNIVNEEQHHSSWAFSDPDTPILKAYIGDPVRIRLVHMGPKETHVFHLHFYQWHHIAHNDKTPIIDAITISPQTGHTIIPLYGAGGRQGAPGDVIWHCHLYPHFHQGMWGIFRTFDLRHCGWAKDEEGQPVKPDKDDFSNTYPDGTKIESLLPLPDREPPPDAIKDDPGFPGFMVDPKPDANRYNPDRAGVAGEKSPRPPWPYRDQLMPPDLDYRPATDAEIGQIFRFHRLKNAPTQKDQQRYPGVIQALQNGETRYNTEPQPAWLFCSYVPPQGVATPDRTFDDLTVVTRKIVYNRHQWHDDFGHLYELANELGANNKAQSSKEEQEGEAKLGTTEHGGGETGGHGNGYPDHEHTHDKDERSVPLFIRANEGEVVRLTLENRLPHKFPCTDFDIQQPRCKGVCPPPEKNQECNTAECALHVHLVKFDAICADGAATGWNYITGPVPGKKMIYRWWVDEEFGTCFFHDHLFANFRQRHGLFGALIAEPKGAEYFAPEQYLPSEQSTPDQPQRLSSGIEAVVRYQHQGVTREFREFCFGLADFVPLFTPDHHPLHKPNVPGAHGDQGWMAMNYRCEPIRERRVPSDQLPQTPLGDPAWWFSSRQHEEEHEETVTFAHPEPSTDIFRTYPNEPIRIRLVQGSHEEQHSFQIHGMRWRRFRYEENSPLRNQQTLGISEAFTFHINPSEAASGAPYGHGDYLWKSSSADDLWCGVWGFIRALGEHEGFPRLQKPEIVADDNDDLTPAPDKIRRFRVLARAARLVYRKSDLVDPFGLVYELLDSAPLGQPLPPLDEELIQQKLEAETSHEPLVLRCRAGEWLEVTLVNRLPARLEPEPFAPAVPEDVPNRPVSRHVSLHADLLRYNVLHSDGANVGHNPEQVVPLGDERTYTWFADRELGPVLLQDMADFRNHRHHGLVGAIVVEPLGATPLAVAMGKDTAANGAAEAWYGTRTTLKLTDNLDVEEIVLLMQDGVRLYLNGNTAFPIPDIPADPGEDAPDFEDQGQKAFNYRAEPSGPPLWIAVPSPDTPIFYAKKTARIRIQLIGACDKPRNHSFTVHAHVWPEWPGVVYTPIIASVAGVTSGSVFTLNLKNSKQAPGDHAYRSGVLRWDVSQGLWGILRLR